MRSDGLRLGLRGLLVCMLLVGCSPKVQKRTYDVTVENRSARTITIWLTKNGPAWEQGWKSPEDLAIESPRADEPIGGVVVPAGKTASTGQRTGRFVGDTDAILRIYLGQHTFNELLAISRNHPGRMDVTLKPGTNWIIITDAEDGVRVIRQDQTPPPAPQSSQPQTTQPPPTTQPVI
ncbi:MAG TPA: hypothetical protein VNL70_08240 [Tepidisphaeraceae bacterium]|nr:hypothetical protein [Tepidisphaeraceae bacterium]